MTDVSDPGTDPATDPATDPGKIVNPPRQPLFSLRRLGLVAVLAVAVAVLAVTFSRSEDAGPQGIGCNDLAVVACTPRPGSHVLRQAEVGVELRPGYDGRITIGNVAIPEEQMQQALDPSSPEFQRLPPEQRDLGPRPNNRNVVKYQPGPGKAVERFNTGEVRITIEFWRESEGRASSRSFSYSVIVA